MAYQTATNKGVIVFPGGPISVGPITPSTANSFAVVACQNFASIAAYDGWSQPGGQGSILVQQFLGQPSITNIATISYLDNLNDEWAAVMAVYETDNGTPIWTVLTGGSFSAFHYPSADLHTVAVNQNDSIIVWVGVGTSIASGQNGGDPGITVTDSDSNQYTFVKENSGFPHDNVAYLFTAFNVNANAALTITVTGGALDPPPTGPAGWSISTITHLINPSGFCFGSTLL
jgi:hypothetical protein